MMHCVAAVIIGHHFHIYSGSLQSLNCFFLSRKGAVITLFNILIKIQSLQGPKTKVWFDTAVKFTTLGKSCNVW